MFVLTQKPALIVFRLFLFQIYNKNILTKNCSEFYWNSALLVFNIKFEKFIGIWYKIVENFSNFIKRFCYWYGFLTLFQTNLQKMLPRSEKRAEFKFGPNLQN